MYPCNRRRCSSNRGELLKVLKEEGEDQLLPCEEALEGPLDVVDEEWSLEEVSVFGWKGSKIGVFNTNFFHGAPSR